MKKYALCLGILLIFIFSVNIAYSAPVGKITFMGGSVTVLKAKKDVATTVKTGDPVDVGDLYRTKGDSGAEITFNNNNIIKIAENTRFEISEYIVTEKKTSNIFKLPEGKVEATTGAQFIKKVSAFAQGHKFEVHTPVAVAGIRGSTGNIAHTGGITGILLSSGTGYLAPPRYMSSQMRIVIFNTVSFAARNVPPTPPQPIQNAVAQIARIAVGQGNAVVQAAVRIASAQTAAQTQTNVAAVINGALQGGVPVTTTVTAAVTAAPTQATTVTRTAVTAAPTQAANITTAAVTAAPTQAANITTAAVTAAPTQAGNVTTAAVNAAPTQA
ncbi:MAG: FecR family protein, partial [Proteobacteria bacterium]|nr:FecR family protein [Pseudomonadota bacterium]